MTVITGFPSYPTWRVRASHRWLLWKRETICGIDVHRRWHYVPGRQSAIRRGLSEGSFLITSLSAMALPRPDIVLGIVPSLGGGLLARLAASRFRVPYGLIFQDLMGPAAEQSGVGSAGWVGGIVRGAEGWAARSAGAIGIIAEGFRPYIESLGVDPDRIQHVRNWTHIQEPVLDRATMRERLGLPQDAVLCLHAGNMGYKQGLENIVECARLAADVDGKLHFVLMGDGNQRSGLETLAARYDLPNLRLLPIQPDDLFPSILAAADILLVNQRASITDMSLPSKLTSYFAAARPVVAAVAPTSEAAREIEASGAGILATPDDPDALLSALQALADSSARRMQLGGSARIWAKTRLSQETAMEDYERLLAAVLASGSSVTTHAQDPLNART